MVTPVVMTLPMVRAGITEVCVTPGCINVRLTRFRPLSGRSETCCSFTTPPSVLLEVCTRGASSATVTVCPWDHGAAGIFHDAQNCPRRELSEHGNRHQQQNERGNPTTSNPLNERVPFKHDLTPLRNTHSLSAHRGGKRRGREQHSLGGKSITHPRRIEPGPFLAP